jgi:hypothetical protein
MVERLYYESSGTVHFNVKFKSGGLLTRLMAREIVGLTTREIEFIYLVERSATRHRKKFENSASVARSIRFC